MDMNAIHVRCTNTGVWTVHLEGEAAPVSSHSSATAAEQAAHEHAEAHGAGPVVIHDRYARTHIAQRHHSLSGSRS